MFLFSLRSILFSIIFILLYCSSSHSITLREAIDSKERTESYTLRDNYRNPYKTLSFFKIKNHMKVIELQPSGGNAPRGWYTEILAPYLKEKGKLIAAHFNPEESDWRAKYRKQFEVQVKNEDNFKEIEMTTLSMPPKILTTSSSVDMVLTFRNLHNWLKAGYLKEVFQVSYDALKPGGIFGVVEHRAPDNFTIKDMNKSGYVSEKIAIEVAEEVGFIFEESSEINSNPKDTKDHLKGVWTLPPTLKLNDLDKEKYLTIGESDRMTLRFKKPN